MAAKLRADGQFGRHRTGFGLVFCATEEIKNGRTHHHHAHPTSTYSSRAVARAGSKFFRWGCVSYSFRVDAGVFPICRSAGPRTRPRNLANWQTSCELAGLEPVGNYGVQPAFSDGHDTGIFTWEYLYFLGSQQEQLWKDYESRLSAANLRRDDPMAEKAGHSCSSH